MKLTPNTVKTRGAGMGRRAEPKDIVSARYEPGPPKKIRIGVVLKDGQRCAAHLSTAAARDLGAFLWDAIDTAEADTIATRGDPTPKSKPKRKRARSNGPKAPARPSRLRRIEAAAIHFHSLLADLVGEEGAPLQLISDSDEVAGLIRSALQELQRELGAAGKFTIQKPQGPSR